MNQRITGLARCGIALAAAIFACNNAVADDIVIKNARLIDGTGADPVEGVNIVVSGEFVTAVTTESVSMENALVIDAKGQTVMPGMINAHVHTTLEFLIPEDFDGDMDEDGIPLEYTISSDDDMKQYMANGFPRLMMQYLESGVTTIVDPGTHLPWGVEARDRINAGEFPGPNLYVSVIFTAPKGHPAVTVCDEEPWCVAHMGYQTRDAEDAREAVRRFVEMGVDGMKIVLDDGTDWDEDGIMGDAWLEPISEDVFHAIVDEAHKQNVPVLGHIFGLGNAELAVLAGIDAFVHYVPMESGSYETPGGYYLPELVNRHNLPMTITLNSADVEGAPEEEREEIQALVDGVYGQSVNAMMDAGVPIIFGDDFYIQSENAHPRPLMESEARAMHALGMSSMQVIVSATGNMARHPYVPHNYGTIRAGSLADILIVPDDPLENTAVMFRPDVVIKSGDVVVDKR